MRAFPFLSRDDAMQYMRIGAWYALSGPEPRCSVATVALWRARDAMRAEDHISSWHRGEVRAGRRVDPMVRSDVEDEDLWYAPDAEADLDRRRAAQKAIDTLDSLEDKHARFLSRWMRGMSIDEIAKDLGMKRGTVYVEACRARREFLRALRAGEEGNEAA